MMDQTHIKNISSNYIRAQQALSVGAPIRELHHLLSAAQHIVEILKDPRVSDKDGVIARQYAESLTHTSARIERILKEELNERNTI